MQQADALDSFFGVGVIFCVVQLVETRRFYLPTGFFSLYSMGLLEGISIADPIVRDRERW